MKYINKFATQAAYDAAEKYYPNVSYIEATDEVVYQETTPPPHDYSQDYLTFEALESGTFTFTIGGKVNQSVLNITSISYSVDNGDNWTTYSATSLPLVITTPTVAQGSKVLWKGSAKQMAKNYLSYNNDEISLFSSTGNFNVSGNIMSLFYNDNFINKTSFVSNTEGNCLYMFKNNNKLINAENLVLPVATLTTYCYGGMFLGCTNLTSIPELNATTLANYCYGDMFTDCTSLATAPILSATTLTTGCYIRMFQNCSNLNSITMLATDISASNCLNNWVDGVAASGTFTKAASMTTLPTGASGIPSGWTVVDATA